MSAPRINPPWELLPSVALEAIFRYVCVPQLAQLRLLCRHWNATICHSPRLMGHFLPRFHGENSVFRAASYDEQLEMSRYTTARFRTALVDGVNIGPLADSPLWASVCQTIWELRVSCDRDCGVKLAVSELVQMLRMMPSLRVLHLSVTSSEVDYAVGEECELDQLERLDLNVYDARLVLIFSEICTNLTEFKFKGKPKRSLVKARNGPYSHLKAADMAPIICANRATLEKISMTEIVMDRAQWLKQIRPARTRLPAKELSLSFGYPFAIPAIKKFELVLVFKAFTSLETLKLKHIFLKSQMLDDIRKNLKQLRSLTVCLRGDEQSKDLNSFLAQSPQLEELSVVFHGESYKHFIDLRGLACPNLRKLKFKNFGHRPDLMQDFIDSLVNVRHLIFDGIYTFDPEAVMGSMEKLKSLHTLNIFVEVGCENNEEEFGFLDGEEGGHFKLESVRVVCTNDFSIARCCPNVVVAELDNDNSVVNDDILRTLDVLPKLEQLFVCFNGHNGNLLNDRDLYNIAEHGKHLRKVHLEIQRNRTSKAARNAVVQALRNYAEVVILVKEY